MSYYGLTVFPAKTVNIGAALAGLALFSCTFLAAAKGTTLARHEKQGENT
jgi:hypothetical protein